MAFSLVPKDKVFFDLFSEAGQNAVRAARMLLEMLQGWPDSRELGRELLKLEQEGDRITHDIVRRLNSTFVTPLDREDIYGLATKLDDIVDYTEEVADFLILYKIEAPMEQAELMADVLVQLLRAARDRTQAPARVQGSRDLLDRDPQPRK